MLQEIEKRIKRYWVPPPVIQSYIEYQDINKDKKLRANVTDYFYDKTKEWINKDEDFSKLKSNISFIQTTDGYKHIYNILRKYIKKKKLNWYDLKDNTNSVKKYIKHNL